MICPNCNKENKNTNIKCQNCGFQLIEDNNSNSENIKIIELPPGCLVNMLMFFMFIPIIMAGLGFTCLGVYQYFSGNNQIDSVIAIIIGLSMLILTSAGFIYLNSKRKK